VVGRRRSLLTPKVMRALLEGLQAGMSRRDAARRAGIHLARFYRWLACARVAREGNRSVPPYSQFLEAIEKAEVKPIGDAVQKIMARHPDWRAAARYLERCHPAEWGRPRLRPQKPELIVRVERVAPIRIWPAGTLGLPDRGTR
jgi:hypothetical protein